MQKEETMDDKKTELYPYLDMLATYLMCGYLWHTKMANECRKIHIRGLGRWHEAEAFEDIKTHGALLKLSRDNLNYAPCLDFEKLSASDEITLSTVECFKQHFTIWIDREGELLWYLNTAIDMSRCIDVEIYKILLCLAEEVQNERVRARWAHDNFAFGKWEGHHILRGSKDIHHYFEHEYDGGKIDFNIG